MKVNLNGRLVGYTEPYFRHPAHVREGEEDLSILTRWARVVDDKTLELEFEGRDLRIGRCVMSATDHFTGAVVYVDRTFIHTVMPESYR